MSFCLKEKFNEEEVARKEEKAPKKPDSPQKIYTFRSL
jgi:hypothetical protein